MFSNLRIGLRLKLGFSALMLGTTCIGGISIYDFGKTISSIKNDLSVTIHKLDEIKLLETNTLVSGYTAIAASKVTNPTDAMKFKEVYSSRGSIILAAEKRLIELEKKFSGEGEKILLNEFFAKREKLSQDFSLVFKLQEQGKIEESYKLIDEKIMPEWDEYRKSIDNAVSYYDTEILTISEKITKDTENSRLLLIGLFLFCLVLGSVISIILTNDIVKPLQKALKISNEIADGKFYHNNQFEKFSKDEIGDLLRTMIKMQLNLTETIQQINLSADEVNNASHEMNERNLDLSSRTEQQASSLEETAATIEELSSAINQNANHSNEAAILAKDINNEAVQGRDLVQKVVKQMDFIKSSSDKISQITSVIDSIAFQTNILALNAAVEAARAGEHGRGFAVVASEVRTLSQRSAQAAKEIKALIEESSINVAEGAKFANTVSIKIVDISKGFQAVTDLISQINVSTQEQNYGIKQIHEAISHIDSVTQQNAALVEESTAVSSNLSQQGLSLSNVIRKFQLL